MASEPAQETAVTDGRSARAQRTRDALVDATMALIEEGDLRPTAPRIAERAGVSVRSVFQHFDDLESLFSLLGDRTFAQIAEVIERVDRDLPLEMRADLFVSQRCRVNEMLTPINRAAISHLASSETITRQFQHGHRLAASDIAEVFAPEIASLGTNGDILLDNLVVVCGWGTWNVLRNLERRSIQESTDRVRSFVHLALIGTGTLER